MVRFTPEQQKLNVINLTRNKNFKEDIEWVNKKAKKNYLKVTKKFMKMVG
jgi:hypothetical protein